LIEIEEKIIYQSKEKFYTWFLLSCKWISQKELKEYKQMVFTNKNLLSRKTQRYISKSGFVSSYATSRRFEQHQINKYITKVKELKSTQVIWFDNYSKFYKTNQISFNKSGFEICNWTVFAKLYTTHEIVEKINKVETTPLTLKDEVLDILSKQNILFKDNYEQYSVTRALKISSVPIRTNQREKEHMFRLDNFLPFKIIDENTSSDIGLFKFLKTIHQNIDNESICPLVVDIKIYWRYYLWLYNKNNDLFYKNTFCVMLGFWHTYKELALLTWKYGLKILFGPIFHKLHPDSKVFLKPKLGHLEIFFTWIF
jgi:hypothetical protein